MARIWVLGWVCIALLWVVLPAAAREYPERVGENTDVIHLEQARSDFELRVNAIDAARESIDVVAFGLKQDDAALPILQALRRAANRGVAIRLIVDQGGTVAMGDVFLRVLRFLTDSGLRRPAQVICARVLPRWRHGLSYDDFVHEKALIIDKGQEDEKIFFGGRLMGINDFSFVDSAFLLRPVDASQPHVGRDIAAAFEALWRLLAPVQGIERIRPAPRSILAAARQTPVPYLRNDAERADYEALRTLVAQRPRRDDVLARYQFRPSSARHVTNDLLQLALERPTNGSLASRRDFPNDITNHVVRLLQRCANGDRVDLTTYSPIFVDEVREALVEVVRRGGIANIVTNGREAHAFLFPAGLTVHYTYEEALRLFPRLDGHPGSLRFHFLDRHLARSAAPPRNAFVYTHRKLLTAGEWVLTGSDNFTPSSARKNDESVVVFHDPRMADYLRDVLAREAEIYETRDSRDIEARYGRRSSLYSWCAGTIARWY